MAPGRSLSRCVALLCCDPPPLPLCCAPPSSRLEREERVARPRTFNLSTGENKLSARCIARCSLANLAHLCSRCCCLASDVYEPAATPVVQQQKIEKQSTIFSRSSHSFHRSVRLDSELLLVSCVVAFNCAACVFLFRVLPCYSRRGPLLKLRACWDSSTSLFRLRLGFRRGRVIGLYKSMVGLHMEQFRVVCSGWKREEAKKLLITSLAGFWVSQKSWQVWPLKVPSLTPGSMTPRWIKCKFCLEVVRVFCLSF